MNTQMISEFKYASTNYLMTLGIDRLRAYGRSKGVARPTTKSKENLIESIVGILSGEKEPSPIATKGAPIKNNYVDPRIDLEIEKIYKKIAEETAKTLNVDTDTLLLKNDSAYDFAAEMEAFRRVAKCTLRVEDPVLQGRESADVLAREVFRGQLETVGGVSVLIAANGRSTEGILVPEEICRRHDLREGDVISCYTEKGNATLICVDVLTINGVVTSALQRQRFEDAPACYPHVRMQSVNNQKTLSATEKYFEWLLPIGQGQRCCILAAPKAGKTAILQALAAYLQDGKRTVLGLLVDQSPETVRVFQKELPQENLAYTTYEDDTLRQVFVADFLLKRAKRLAESGQDVVLLVDSLSALARAYNDTEESVGGRTLAGGMESKTLHYIKKYFGAARCLEGGGALTMIACANCATGNPFDDLLVAELAGIANAEIRLDESLALKHSYPAFDVQTTCLNHLEYLYSEAEYNRKSDLWRAARAQGSERTREALLDSDTLETFEKKMRS